MASRMPGGGSVTVSLRRSTSLAMSGVWVGIDERRLTHSRAAAPPRRSESCRAHDPDRAQRDRGEGPAAMTKPRRSYASSAGRTSAPAARVTATSRTVAQAAGVFHAVRAGQPSGRRDGQKTNRGNFAARGCEVDRLARDQIEPGAQQVDAGRMGDDFRNHAAREPRVDLDDRRTARGPPDLGVRRAEVELPPPRAPQRRCPRGRRPCAAAPQRGSRAPSRRNAAAPRGAWR